jgi:hypothetical protein
MIQDNEEKKIDKISFLILYILSILLISLRVHLTNMMMPKLITSRIKRMPYTFSKV